MSEHFLLLDDSSYIPPKAKLLEDLRSDSIDRTSLPPAEKRPSLSLGSEKRITIFLWSVTNTSIMCRSGNKGSETRPYGKRRQVIEYAWAKLIVSVVFPLLRIYVSICTLMVLLLMFMFMYIRLHYACYLLGRYCTLFPQETSRSSPSTPAKQDQALWQ